MERQFSTTDYIAYYRVSTDRQGKSGLGLEAQQIAVANHLKTVGGTLMSEFVEVESGRKKTRPQLQTALNACRSEKAVLCIAKLDRLARNVAFIANLMEARVEFVAVDNPHANKLMLHMLAAFAEHEREQISQRTREALAAAKARGVELGKNGKALAYRNKQQAASFALQVRPIIQLLKNEGHVTLRALASELNNRNIPTARGGQWHEVTVHRLLRRLRAESDAI